MTSRVSNSDERLEARALTSRGLLLDGHDLHDLVLELVLEEVVDDLGLLDRDGEEEDFFETRGPDLGHRESHAFIGMISNHGRSMPLAVGRCLIFFCSETLLLTL